MCYTKKKEWQLRVKDVTVKSPQHKPTRRLSIAMKSVTKNMRLRSSQMQLLSRAPAQPELSQGRFANGAFLSKSAEHNELDLR